MIEVSLHKILQGGDAAFNLSINETIAAHSFIALFGKSGVGKTTFFRMLAGLELPDKGFIEVGGKVWSSDSPKQFIVTKDRNIGYVTQQSILFPNMTVKEQLTFAKGKNTDFQLLEEVITLMEIENLMNALPEMLSGGQQQRVAIARAIIQKPQLLLLDEPFTALDYQMRQQLIGLTKKVTQKYKMTTLLISHHPIEIEQLASEVWIIEKGKVVKKGNPIDILAGYK